MAANKAKKVTKMATKACPDCDQQIPVACKSCPCGFIFISRRLLNAKQTEKLPPPNLDSKAAAKRRRTERARREKANSPLTKDLENRKRSRSESHSEQIRRRRGRPKTGPSKKHDDDKGEIVVALTGVEVPCFAAYIAVGSYASIGIGSCGKWVQTGLSLSSYKEPAERPDKDVDVYASLSDERAFVFSVALAEINRKIINQKLIL